jgi:16S rRNA (guanine966-N2)-methyltransferase
VRVIGGSARGITLTAPPRTSATRPTSDLVRGAMFNMLEAAGADFSVVLDLYAGSGALGIEALSRGEGTCDFVERDPRACETIKRNLRVARVEERGRVLCGSVARALDRAREPYTLILADPPYADEDAISALARYAAHGHVADTAMLALEHGKRRTAPETLGALERFRERRHGDTVITLYRAAQGAPAPAPDFAEETEDVP